MSIEIIENEVGRWDSCHCCGHEYWEPIAHGPRPRPPDWALFIPEMYSDQLAAQMAAEPLFGRLFSGRSD